MFLLTLNFKKFQLIKFIIQVLFFSTITSSLAQQSSLSKAVNYISKYIASEEFVLAKKKFGDVAAVDTLFNKAIITTNGNISECLLALMFSTVPYREIPINIPILNSTVYYPLISAEEELFFITSVRGANGIGKTTSEGFVVFKNSQVADPVTNSYPKSMQKLRDILINDGVIVNEHGKFVLSRDYLFSSSSSAAMIIMGRSANGLIEWKLKSGKTLQDFETGDEL